MRNILKKLLVFALLISMCMWKNVNIASADEQKSFVYTEENFEVKYTVNGEWDQNYYNVSFEIKNISDEVIENWFLGMSMDGSIEQIWDATIYSHEVDHYVIKNATYNSNIAPGETIGFGCVLKLNEKEAFPQEFYMPVKTEAVKEERYTLQIESVDSWENRNNYKITIENTSMQTIEDWSIEFDLNGEIESFWDCKLVSREGTRYRLSNSDYNRIIKQGERVSFHVIVESNVKQKPEEVVLYEITSDGIKIAEKLVNAEYFEEFEIVTDLYEVMPLYTTDGRISAYMVQYYNDNNEPTGYVVVSNEVGCLNYYIEFGIGRANMIERVINAVEDDCKEEVERVIYVGGYTYYVAIGDDIYTLDEATPRLLTKEETLQLIVGETEVIYYNEKECLNLNDVFQKEVGFLRTERKDSPNVPRIIDYRTMSEAKNACLPEMITNHCGPTAGLNVLIYLSKLGYQTLPIDDNGWKKTFRDLYGSMMSWVETEEGLTKATEIGNFVKTLEIALEGTGIELQRISSISWDKAKLLLEKGGVVFLLQGSQIYGDHYVFGTGYQVFYHSTGWVSKYFRIMDGWKKEHRYINYSLGIDRIEAVAFDLSN